MPLTFKIPHNELKGHFTVERTAMSEKGKGTVPATSSHVNTSDRGPVAARVVKRIEESDSDDDIPLSVLIARRAAASSSHPPGATNSSVKQVVNVKKGPSGNKKEAGEPPEKKTRLERPQETAQAKKVSKSSKKSTSSTSSHSSSSVAPRPSSSSGSSSSGNPHLTTTQNFSCKYYEDTKKGQLTQCLLVRWWYAVTWPLDEEVGIPPAGYVPLDGFKGVFVSLQVSWDVNALDWSPVPNNGVCLSTYLSTRLSLYACTSRILWVWYETCATRETVHAFRIISIDLLKN